MGRENALKERHAYNGILRGIIALIVFSVIILTPHIITFVITTTMDYDDDSTYEGGLDQDETDSSCALGENYDPEKCFEELKSTAIMFNLFQILIYLIPIYGLIEVYRGVSRISELRTTIGIELSESNHPIKLDNAKNDIDIMNTDDVEKSEGSESLISPEVLILIKIEFLVIIVLVAMAIAYVFN
jgi:hypothetical protein